MSYFPSPTVLAASYFAAGAHGAINQKRKYTNDDYIIHPEEVVNKLIEHCIIDVVTLSAGWLHDTIEDTSVTEAMMLTNFGKDITGVVVGVTDVSTPEDGGRDVRKRMERELWSRGCDRVKSLKCADLICNGNSIIDNDAKFAVVYMNEVKLALPALRGAQESLHVELTALVDEYYRNVTTRREQAVYRRSRLKIEGDKVIIPAKCRKTNLRIFIIKPPIVSNSLFGDAVPYEADLTVVDGVLHVDGLAKPKLKLIEE